MSQTLREMEKEIHEFDFHMETNQEFFDQHSLRNEVLNLLERFKLECDKADRILKDEVFCILDEIV